MSYSEFPEDARSKEGEPSALSLVKGAIQDALSTYSEEPALKSYAESKKFLQSQQDPVVANDKSSVHKNILKKVFLETASGLSDLREVWEWTTYNAKYEATSGILNKLSRSWWRNTAADVGLGDSIKHAELGGTGFLVPQWDPDMPGGGDIKLMAFGVEDVLPYIPRLTGNVQDWQGILIREKVAVADVQSQYPLRAGEINDTLFNWDVAGNDARSNQGVPRTPLDVLFGRKKLDSKRSSKGVTDLVRFYFKDPCLNTGTEPKLMGDPGKSWSYIVYPLGSTNPLTGDVVDEKGALLYPNGRLWVLTPTALLHDGPNPYWHGQLPATMVTLDYVPWLLLGLPFLADLLPMQKELNRLLRGVGNACRQWFKRGIIADKGSIAKTNVKAIDTEAAGFRIFYNQSAGAGMELSKGPELPNWVFEWVKEMSESPEQIGGTFGMAQQLAQLKQLPSQDALQGIMDALSPMLRGRARQLEIALGRVAHQMKYNFMQFYDTKRRLQILGPAGVLEEDLDFDPGTFVPGFGKNEQDNPSYDSELDINLHPERSERAKAFAKNFAFTVKAGSLLNLTHMQTKLLNMQLFGRGILDPWTVWESFDVKGAGVFPAETVVERIEAAKKKGLMPGPTEEVASAMEQLQLATSQAQMMMAQMQVQQAQQPPQEAPTANSPVAAGPPPSGAPSKGRPPSFNAPPRLETKTTPEGGERSTVTTSR